MPQIWKFIAKDEDKKAVELVVSQQVFGRPYLAPPGTPAEQVKILRDAFRGDHEGQGIPRRRGKGARSTSTRSDGAKVQEVVKKLYATPAATIERAKEIIKN